MSEYTCLQCTQDCHGESARQARTIRRLRALADGYRAKAMRNGETAARNCEQCSNAATLEERARIVAAIRDCVWERVSGPKDVADAIERGVL